MLFAALCPEVLYSNDDRVPVAVLAFDSGDCVGILDGGE